MDASSALSTQHNNSKTKIQSRTLKMNMVKLLSKLITSCSSQVPEAAQDVQNDDDDDDDMFIP